MSSVATADALNSIGARFEFALKRPRTLHRLAALEGQLEQQHQRLQGGDRENLLQNSQAH